MKLLKLGLRFWMTLTSLISFVTGWILLAQTPKITTSSSSTSTISTAVPTLEPIQPLSGFDSNEDNSQNQPSFNFQAPQNQPRPSFRTGGS